MGMLVVCFHNDFLNGDVSFFYTEEKYESNDHYILNVLNRMKITGAIYWCSLEAFVNLYAYDVDFYICSLVTSSQCWSALMYLA